MVDSASVREQGERFRELLTAEAWDRCYAPCEARSQRNILQRLDYFCLYPMTIFIAHIPA